MTSQISSLCMALDEKGVGSQAYNSLLLQFIRSTTIDPEGLRGFADDQSIGRFIGFLFSAIVNEDFPAPSEGIVPFLQLQCVQFLTLLALNHPDLLTIIATLTPMNDLPYVFFRRNFNGEEIIDAQESHLLSSLRFLMAISCSHSLSFSSVDAMKVLFGALFSLFHVHGLSALAIGIVSGLLHNCLTAADYVKSLPILGKLKNELLTLLSSTDQGVVIAAMSTMTILFDIGPDSKLFTRLAVKALIDPPPLPCVTALAIWSLLDFDCIETITAENYFDILCASIHADGVRALQIFKCLTELHHMKFDSMRVVKQQGMLCPILRYLILSRWDYVIASGIEYIETIVEGQKSLIFSEDITELFSMALSLVADYSTKFSLLRIQSLVSLLRILTKADAYTESITEELETNKHNLLMGLQRQIEAKNAFLSVMYFIFIVDCLKFVPEWKFDLLQLAAVTQFSSLLAYVITHSNNRVVVTDAIQTAILIGCEFSPNYQISPMIDAIASGFLFCNRESADEKKQLLQASKKETDELRTTANVLLRDKRTLSDSLEQVTHMKTDLDQLVATLKTELTSAKNDNDVLTTKLAQRHKRNKALRQALVKATQESEHLNQELQKRNTQWAELNESYANAMGQLKTLKTFHTEMKSVAIEKKDLEEQNTKLSTDLKTATQLAHDKALLAEEQESGRKTAESRLYEVSNQLNTAIMKLHEQEASTDQYREQAKRAEKLVKRKQSIIDSTENTNRNLRQQIDQLKMQLANKKKALRERTAIVADLRAQLMEFESRTKDQDTLCQFIHKITQNEGTTENDDSSDST